MKLTCAFVAGALLAPMVTQAQQVAGGGVGIEPGSCRKMVFASDLALVRDYLPWISGFWTGLNAMNPRNQGVGRTFRIQKDYLDAVFRACEPNPNQSLVDAEIDAYGDAARQGR